MAGDGSRHVRDSRCASSNMRVSPSSAFALMTLLAVIATGCRSQTAGATAQASQPCFPQPSTAPPTLSPEERENVRREIIWRAQRLPEWMTLVDSKYPYNFVLQLYLQGLGATVSKPELRPGSLRLTLKNSSGKLILNHLQLLDAVPQPLETRGPCSTLHALQIGLAIEPRGLPSDMYQVQADAIAEPAAVPDFGIIGPWRAELLPWRIYVPHSPDEIPSKRIGQEFLVFPGPSDSYYDQTGAEIPRRAIVMHVATLSGIAGNRLTFSVRGLTKQRIVLDWSDQVTDIPGLPALVIDRNLRALNAMYDGKMAWGRGSFGGSCILETAGGAGGGGGSGSKPVKVLQIFRLYRAGINLGIGTYFAGGGTRESAFTTESPLVVWFQFPKDTHFNSMWGTSASIHVRSRYALPTVPPSLRNLTPAPMAPSPECVAWYVIVADAWDMDRSYTRQPATQAHPEWGPEILNAVMKGSVKVGMTREQVAWTIGYPGEYGPIEKFLTMTKWRYDDISPFNYWVYFDRNGRVNKFGPDGELP